MINVRPFIRFEAPLLYFGAASTPPQVTEEGRRGVSPSQTNSQQMFVDLWFMSVVLYLWFMFDPSLIPE